jgi:trehalose synthase
MENRVGIGIAEVDIEPLDIERFEEVLDPDRYEELIETVVRALELFDGRTIWNINSTARGGGVAEMLQSLLAYARGAGVDTRWLVISGNPDFFKVTKRLHNHLHGSEGDGGPLGDEEHAVYDQALKDDVADLLNRVGKDDIVMVHDPQPAGLINHLKGNVAATVWRCHVGLDLPNDTARRAWNFLTPYVASADAYVFSRAAYAWEGLDPEMITVIPPSIDAFAPKNQPLEMDQIRSILAASQLVSGERDGNPTFLAWDGTRRRVERATIFCEGGPPPPAEARFVVQVSRWDRLKDPLGVIEGFAKHVSDRHPDAHLVMAGPAVAAVSDDPEGQEVLEEARVAWSALDQGLQSRVHLACLPMEDGEENAAIVNALQRRADVVVQKSLAEGFGLTVSEAMWKARPVVASRIGGIQDQIVDGDSGLLVSDPHDLEEFGNAVVKLLDDPKNAERMGKAAQERVRDEFLGARHLIQYVDLLEKLIT